MREIVRHSPYNTNLHNDTSILILEQPLNITSYIGTICLPDNFVNNGKEKCEVAGWCIENGKFYFLYSFYRKIFFFLLTFI